MSSILITNIMIKLMLKKNLLQRVVLVLKSYEEALGTVKINSVKHEEALDTVKINSVQNGVAITTVPFSVVNRQISAVVMVVRGVEVKLDIYDFYSHGILYNNFINIKFIKELNIPNMKPRVDFNRFYQLKSNASIRVNELIHFKSLDLELVHYSLFDLWFPWALNVTEEETCSAHSGLASITKELKISKVVSYLGCGRSAVDVRFTKLVNKITTLSKKVQNLALRRNPIKKPGWKYTFYMFFNPLLNKVKLGQGLFNDRYNAACLNGYTIVLFVLLLPSKKLAWQVEQLYIQHLLNKNICLKNETFDYKVNWLIEFSLFLKGYFSLKLNKFEIVQNYELYEINTCQDGDWITKLPDDYQYPFIDFNDR